MSEAYIGNRRYNTLAVALDDAVTGDIIILTGGITLIDTEVDLDGIGLHFCPGLSALVRPMQDEIEALVRKVLPLPGSICEECFDTPTSQLQDAPWGGEMGVCRECIKIEKAITITRCEMNNHGLLQHIM